MRGKTKPLEIQIAEGDPSHRGPGRLKRWLAQRPSPERGLPSCPQQLESPRARQLWLFYSDQLVKMGVDRTADAGMLQSLCLAQARAEEADAIVHREGLMVECPIYDSVVRKNKDGKNERMKVKIGMQKAPNPALEVSVEQWKLFEKFSSKFGFSPAALEHLTVDKGDREPDIKDKILSGYVPEERVSQAN